MFKETFSGLVSLLGQIRISSNEKDMLTYAKTEYGNDWQFVYEYLMAYDQAPMLANHSAIRGVTK
jgi:hypothetical protein